MQDEGRAGRRLHRGDRALPGHHVQRQPIATNVAVEKSTRIAEVLLAVLRPSQILVGNVLGIGAATFHPAARPRRPGHAGPWRATAWTCRRSRSPTSASGWRGSSLGYFIYAFLFAATAALVDKVTDVASAILPVTALLILGYLGAVIVVVQNPSSALSVALSMFPLSSPMAMPIRWASGTVPIGSW